jgi:transposase-like protein
MSRRTFTKEQIDEMLKNTNVSYCSDRSITYTKQFKLLAIKLYEQGLTSSEIFRRAGFELDVVGRHQPKECLSRWRELFRAKGADGLSDQRGKTGRSGRPRTKGITETDKIKRLEAEVAYLKAENDFLAKLRAKRAESNSGRSKNTRS